MQATQAAPAAARRDLAVENLSAADVLAIRLAHVADLVSSAGEWPDRCVEAIEPKVLERWVTERQRSADGFVERLERFRDIEFTGNALVPVQADDEAVPLAVVGYSAAHDCRISFELVIVHPRTNQRGMVAEFEPAVVV